MVHTSSDSIGARELRIRELGSEVLQRSLHGPQWPQREIEELVRCATSHEAAEAAEATKVIFRDIVEPLCDSFEAAATEIYARLFASIVGCVLPQFSPDDLLGRYRRVRKVRRYNGAVSQVYVLSRVTLGADVAITSSVLTAARTRFPQAKIHFVGPAKNAALFAGLDFVTPIPWTYDRGDFLRGRLMASANLADLLQGDDALVIDPDSRLSQLAMIPVCPESRYLFFESRTYGGDSDETLPVLTGRWLSQALGIAGARPRIAPAMKPRIADITVSLGVGGNDAKAGGPELERRAMARLASLGRRVLVDRGAGGEEGARVDRILEEIGRPSNVAVHEGSFASFAAQILQSDLYFGYDSAGQHVAAASGVPLICVFSGYASERTYSRWRPCGPGPMEVIKVTHENRGDAAERTLDAIDSLARTLWVRKARPIPRATLAHPLSDSSLPAPPPLTP